MSTDTLTEDTTNTDVPLPPSGEVAHVMQGLGRARLQPGATTSDPDMLIVVAKNVHSNRVTYRDVSVHLEFDHESGEFVVTHVWGSRHWDEPKATEAGKAALGKLVASIVNKDVATYRAIAQDLAIARDYRYAHSLAGTTARRLEEARKNLSEAAAEEAEAVQALARARAAYEAHMATRIA